MVTQWRDGQFWIQRNNQDFWLRENGVWVRKGNIRDEGSGGIIGIQPIITHGFNMAATVQRIRYLGIINHSFGFDQAVDELLRIRLLAAEMGLGFNQNSSPILRTRFINAALELGFSEVAILTIVPPDVELIPATNHALGFSMEATLLRSRYLNAAFALGFDQSTVAFNRYLAASFALGFDEAAALTTQAPPRRIMAATVNTTPGLYFYDDTGALEADPADGIPSTICTNLNLSKDGRWLGVVAGGTTNQVWVYNIGETTIELAYQLDPPSGWSLNAGTRILFTDDATRMIVTHFSASPYIWSVSLSDGSTETVGFTALAAINRSALEGNILALAYQTSPYLEFRNPSDWSSITLPFSDPSALPGQVAFSPDGSYFAYRNSSDNSLHAFRTSDWLELTVSGTTMSGAHNGQPQALVWSPDNQWLVSGNSSSPWLYIYKLSGTTLTRQSDPAELPVDDAAAMAFTNNSDYLVVFGFDVSGAERFTVYDTATWARTVPADQPSGITPQGVVTNYDTLNLPPPVTPSTTTFNSGSGNYEVPNFNTLTIEVWGAGAPGSATSPAGLGSGASTVSHSGIGLSMTAGGGFCSANNSTLVGGLGGTASGGDVNTNGNSGGAGSNNSNQAGGKGGDAPNGGTGGAGGAARGVSNGTNVGQPGTAPGAGGGGLCTYSSAFLFGGTGAGGGSGAYSKKVLNAGDIAVGELLAYAVGAARARVTANDGNGAAGRVRFTVA